MPNKKSATIGYSSVLCIKEQGTEPTRGGHFYGAQNFCFCSTSTAHEFSLTRYQRASILAGCQASMALI